MSENNAKILIIDDDESMRDSCSQVLRKSGYFIETAENGEKGLSMTKELNPDLILLDLKMPGMSGTEVLKRLKEFDSRIIIIIITGYATVESAVDSMKQGVYEYLPKPFTPKELRKIVQHGLLRRKCLMEADRLRNEKEKMRKNFVSLVSHELRSPLSAVQQNLMTITSGMMGEIPDSIMDTLNRLSRRINALTHLINDWLDLSKIESGEMAIERKNVDLRKILLDIINLFEPSAEKQKINLKLEDSKDNYNVLGNIQTLEMLFSNLIHNAIKYNRKDGSVKVVLEKNEKFIKVEVKDTGIGIPEEKLPLIFEQFYRIKDKTLVEGSGLGLSIVQKIVDLHQGTIDVSSKEGKGTTFMVKLPTGYSSIKDQSPNHQENNQ
ncbi:MAG: response regulator [bacterium]